MDPSLTGADPTVPLEVYNGTVATGGDSRIDNLNVYYNVSFVGSEFPYQTKRGANATLAWRHRLDDHGNCSRASDDSWSRVSNSQLQP
jgi:hypothetical protein